MEGKRRQVDVGKGERLGDRGHVSGVREEFVAQERCVRWMNLILVDHCP